MFVFGARTSENNQRLVRVEKDNFRVLEPSDGGSKVERSTNDISGATSTNIEFREPSSGGLRIVFSSRV